MHAPLLHTLSSASISNVSGKEAVDVEVDRVTGNTNDDGDVLSLLEDIEVDPIDVFSPDNA